MIVTQLLNTGVTAQNNNNRPEASVNDAYTVSSAKL